MGRLAIIGGGAAGLAAAVTAARELRLLGVPGDVAVYEADERVGRSILATGNGRCNFSNARIDAGAYRNAAFVEAALGALAACSEEMAGLAPEGTCGAAGPDPVHAFFAGLGLVWREEGEGRLYPLANKATSVLDVLRAAAADFGVAEACGRRAVRLDVPDRPGGRFHLRFADGTVGHADAVVLATGGRTARELLPEGIGFAAARPVLGPVRTATDVVRHLNNLRVRCAVTLAGPDGAPKAREAGELLFRDYGVSGIAVFNLSRFAEAGDMLRIDLLPRMDAPMLEQLLLERRSRLFARAGSCTGDDVLRGMVLPAVGRGVLKAAGLRAEGPFGKRDAAPLAAALKGLALEVRGVGEPRQCQVRRGGFAVEAFDPRSCASRTMPGLHVVGEALDVDAPCGGYNLHWAWASGMLAGRAAAERLMKEAVDHA